MEISVTRSVCSGRDGTHDHLLQHANELLLSCGTGNGTVNELAAALELTDNAVPVVWARTASGRLKYRERQLANAKLRMRKHATGCNSVSGIRRKNS
jgi:hypothetical protein